MIGERGMEFLSGNVTAAIYYFGILAFSKCAVKGTVGQLQPMGSLLLVLCPAWECC